MLSKRKIKSQFMVITLSKDVIPDKAISLLNFADESLATWKDSASSIGDIAAFINELYNESTLIVTEQGGINSVNYSIEIAKQYLEQGIEESKKIAEYFTMYALNRIPAPNAHKNYKPINPDYFFHNQSFGKTLKYLIAWNNISSNILAESAFFSLAHLLETATDIEASVNMASQLYYKQSFQILRGFLENSVFPVYFCNQQNEFKKWRSNNFHNPPLRGKNGLLKKLEQLNLITKDLSDNLSDLYGQLNGSIHGGEKYLIHKGIYTNQWSGLLFKEQDFLDWCRAVSNAIEVGAKLLKINVKQLMSLRGSGNIVCENCHNDKNLKLNEFIFGGRNFRQYSCSLCGDQSTFDEHGYLAHQVTQYEE